MYYFSAVAAWSVVFLKRSRRIAPIYYFLVAMGLLAATCHIDYDKYPWRKYITWVGFNLMFGASFGVYLYHRNHKVMFDFLYLFSNTVSLYAAVT